MTQRIAIILGRGVENCGVTANAVQLRREMNADVYAISDRKWGRPDQGLPVTLFSAEKEWESMAAKLNAEYDLVVLLSIPAKNFKEGAVSGFLKMVQALTVRVAFLNVDHKMASITRNANLLENCMASDVILTHSLTNDFCRKIAQLGNTTPVKTMGVGFDYDAHRAKYWKPIDQQDNRHVRWIGRTTGWKNPVLLMEFHEAKLRDLGFITMLEGLEASISWNDIIYRTGKGEDGSRRDVVNYFRREKGVDTQPELQYGSEEEGKGAYLYVPYKNEDCMERMSKSAFGSDLFLMPQHVHGDNLEYCHCEVIASGTVPVFHKDFLDTMIHRGTGDTVSNSKNNGTIGLNWNNWQETADLMVKLKNDPVMRDEWREMSFEFWKQHNNVDVVVSRMLNDINN